MDIIETFTYQENEIDFRVDVVDNYESALFSDMWVMTDEHRGGVTVKNPELDRNSYKYAIPKNFTLAERAAELSAQGEDNPSAVAYQQVQKELQRDICASDYSFHVSASCNGIELLNSVVVGCGFDYSYLDDENLEDLAKDVYNENDVKSEALELAKEKVKEILSLTESLKNIL